MSTATDKIYRTLTEKAGVQFPAPAFYMPCGCCMFLRRNIVQLAGGKQRYETGGIGVSFCRPHREGK